MSIEMLTPAQRTQRLIAEARRAVEEDERRQREWKEKYGRNRGEIVHGTVKGYRRGCRCKPCKKSWSNYINDYRLKKGIVKERRGGWTHGIPSTYFRGCRCEECTPAGVEYNARMRARRKQMKEQENA